jgi:hypothetical protein
LITITGAKNQVIADSGLAAHCKERELINDLGTALAKLSLKRGGGNLGVVYCT